MEDSSPTSMHAKFFKQQVAAQYSDDEVAGNARQHGGKVKAADLNRTTIFYSTHNALTTTIFPSEYKIYLRIVERGGLNRDVDFEVYPFHDVEIVKRMMIKLIPLPKSTLINDICLYYAGTELGNRRCMNPFGVMGRKVKLSWRLREQNACMGIRESSGMTLPADMEVVLGELKHALTKGYHPRLVDDGAGGTYFMHNTQRRCIAIFKPRDEEPFTPNNPKGYVNKMGSRGFTSGVLSGDGALREVAAFLLDSHYDNFCGVPLTAKVEAAHEKFCYTNDYEIDGPMMGRFVTEPAANGTLKWKEGSLQVFIENAESAADFDPNMYSISEVQRIAIFDMKVMNLDRNDGNLLVQRLDHKKKLRGNLGLTPTGATSSLHLVPIDHGLILPFSMDLTEMDLAWYHWPQVKMPTGEEELYHIFTLLPDRDSRRLTRRLNIPAECVRTMRVTTRLLQIGSRMRLTLQMLAQVMCRDWEEPERQSELESIVSFTTSQAYAACNSRIAGATTGIDLEMTNWPEMQDRINRLRGPNSQHKDTGAGSDDEFKMKSSSDASKSGTTKNRTTGAQVRRGELGSSSGAASSSLQLSVPNEDDDYDDGGDSFDDSEPYTSKLSGAPIGREWKSRKTKTSADSDRWTPNRRLGQVPKTASRLTGSTTARRGLSSVGPTSAWALYSTHGKVVPVDWDDDHFDRVFFSIFESHLKMHLKNKHPEWKSYPYNGKAIEKEISLAFSQKRKRPAKPDSNR